MLDLLWVDVAQELQIDTHIVESKGRREGAKRQKAACALALEKFAGRGNKKKMRTPEKKKETGFAKKRFGKNINLHAPPLFFGITEQADFCR